MQSLTTLLLKLPRNSEVTPEASKTFLAALTQVNSLSFWQKLFGLKPQPLALEIASINQQIQFLITCASELVSFIQTQIQSNYPLVIIEKTSDPLANLQPIICNLQLKRGNFYPLATYDKFTEIDPMASLLSILAKSEPNQVTLIQICLESISSSWQTKGATFADHGVKNIDGTYSPRPDKNIIIEKINYPGFRTSIRLISNNKDILKELVSAFAVFTRADGNAFNSRFPIFNLRSEVKNSLLRKVSGRNILNIMELATLWHLPGQMIKTPMIVWGTSVLSEPPDNLPTALNLSETEKREINFFGRTIFKNRNVIFGIKDHDRRRHLWTIGKTGTGKSTLLVNMTIDDMKKGRGVAFIDPHGDACEILLDYIPKSRINDVIYFNPADRDYPIVVNPLEVTNREEAEIVTSGLMAIFTKVWENVWSARMEYILRNAFLTMAQAGNATLEDVLRLLVDKNMRARVLAVINDPSLIRFWRDEYEKMPDRLQKEAISPIQNKVGQFVTSPLIRRIIGHPKSSISIEDIMNQGKIFLCNLSQGRLGEDNSALLGATIITKIQIAAMRRVDQLESGRRDFYLYVDEFQNFATSSFIKILSEARKYRLNLILANQYMAQIPEDVQKAILGNAGSIIAFSIGASDAEILYKEFAEVFSQNDLVNLSNYQIAVKLMIDGQSSRPFLAHTLPLPISRNQNRNKVIAVSRERWAKKK